MVTKNILCSLHDEKGQSILEVIFILPLLFLFVGLLVKLNMAAQVAINNTQAARSQLYFLTSNQPEYPRLEFRFYIAKSFVAQGQDQMVLGIADPEGLDFENPTIAPNPQTQKIGRNSTSKGSEERGEKIKTRVEIRVRNTAAICTQLNSVGGKTAMTSDAIPTLGAQRWPFKQKVCGYKGES
jgi:hypothetical protein